MRNYIYLALTIFILGSCAENLKEFTNAEISLVPEPSLFILEEKSFLFSKNTTIFVEDEYQKSAANYLSDIFRNASGYELAFANSRTGANIVFSKDDTLKSEGYSLVIDPKQIVIKAGDAAGYFYAIQTLRQLLPPAIETKSNSFKEYLVPCVTINDAPRFSWRGMHMDFSRHFFTVDEVKTFLDYMALYKLNTYHMHLTDDQGWRVEIKKYPLLTEKGAWRIESSHDKECKKLAKMNPSFAIDEQHYHNRDGQTMYGGFYTQEQIKEIVAYASERHIEVIPEIDMPGHFKSAIDNYPYLSCSNEAGWGQLFSIPACLGKETSYEFAKNVLSEIAALFPSQYIHIGGDEVNTKPWKQCLHCQKILKENQIQNEHELQSYFNKNIEAFLKTKGKKLIGWDEIVEGGLSQDATIMWWRNWAPNMRNIAADNGNNIIICPDFEYYFDFTNEATPIEKVYNYEPIPEEFSENQAKFIIGVQANLWSEWIPNFERLEYQAFPRMLALAETGWTIKENRNFEDFLKRMSSQYIRLDDLGIHFYIPSVKGQKDKIAFIDTAMITLIKPLDNMEIYYTVDGSVPSNKSIEYTSPIKITKTTTLKTVAYKGELESEIKVSLVEKQKLIAPKNINPDQGKINRWIDFGKFNVVEEVSLPKKVKWKPVQEINLSGYEHYDNISMVFQGYFMADEDGLYEFSTKSDDGSLLYIGEKLVVDNGGNHAAILKEGMIALKRGWHPITIKFHEAGGGNELTVWYKSPSGEKKVLNGNCIGFD